jgi:Polyketide cyclase / dehydrase and lipid transport
MSGDGTRIAAEHVVAASPEDLFSFLADLESHWLLADRFVEVLTLERPPGGGPAHGGTVRMRGPLGLGRTVRTRVVEAEPPRSMAGTAKVGPRTEALVRWTLTPVSERTQVRLEATVVRAGAMDAALLAAGGRRWLERRFASILATLARRVGRAAQLSSA